MQTLSNVMDAKDSEMPNKAPTVGKEQLCARRYSVVLHICRLLRNKGNHKTWEKFERLSF